MPSLVVQACQTASTLACTTTSRSIARSAAHAWQAANSDRIAMNFFMVPPRKILGALPRSFVQADAGGNGYVQALHGAAHRDGNDVVAGLARELPHAGAFRAEHERRRPLQV